MTPQYLELRCFINALRHGTTLVLRNANIPKGGQECPGKLTWGHFLPSQERHSLGIREQAFIKSTTALHTCGFT